MMKIIASIVYSRRGKERNAQINNTETKLYDEKVAESSSVELLMMSQFRIN